MKIVYAPRALRDLQHIDAWISAQSKASARRVLAAIKSTIDDLEQFPRIGLPIDDEDRYRIPVVHYPYIVLYRIDVQKLFILHVRHGSRRPIEVDEL